MVARPRLARLALAALVVTLAAPVARADSGRAALDLTPTGSAVVVAIDLEQFRTTAYYARVRDLILARPELRAGVDKAGEVGVDLERDVVSVVAAVPAGASGDRFVLIAGGDFSRVDLARLAPTARRERHGIAYFAADEQTALVKLGRHLALGTTAEIEAVIDVAAGKARGLGKSREVKALLARIGARGDAWLVADTTKLAGGGMPGLTRVALGVDLGNGAAIRARLGHKDELQAQAFLDQLNASSASVASMVSRLTSSRAGRYVDVEVDLDQGRLDGLLAMLSL